MGENNGVKSEDNKQFIVNLYKQSLIFENKNNIIKNFNQYNDLCLYSPKSKDLVRIKSL